MTRVGTRFAVAAALGLSALRAAAADSAVVLIYHHVDDDTPAATSVRPAEFAAQLEFIEEGGYRVLPLFELIEALSGGEPVPENSVAITFDDAYVSVLTEAMPLLSERGWPFTVFVGTEAVDAGYRNYLNWEQLRTLGAAGATIGNHSVSHAHLVRRDAGETEAAWVRRVAAEIETARERLAAEVGDYLIPVFAWPYGEYMVELKPLLAELGYFGLGQQSGAMGRDSDFAALPRYPVATGMNLDDEFALRLRSLPLPVSLTRTEAHVVMPDDPRPALEFAVADSGDIRLAELACYAPAQGRMPLELIDADRRVYRARPVEPLGVGRSKYNCTAPSRMRTGAYYWYSYLWMRRHDDGRWYEE